MNIADIIVSEDIWKTLTPEQKTKRIADALDVLVQIEHGTHELSHKPEQGRLSLIRQQLEAFILAMIKLEDVKDEEPILEEEALT